MAEKQTEPEDGAAREAPAGTETGRSAEPAQEKPKKEKKLPGADFFDLFQMLMVCILGAVLFFNCFARITRVDGRSMDHTLEDGELMVIWSLGYEPRPGDIVVFNKKNTDEFGGNALVKRVIATGGQRVDIDYSTGTVYVDGEALDEPYLPEPMEQPMDPREQGTHWDVPEGYVFCMGDNRNHSSDGRHDSLGPIDTRYLLGGAVLALWPPDRIGLM